MRGIIFGLVVSSVLGIGIALAAQPSADVIIQSPESPTPKTGFEAPAPALVLSAPGLAPTGSGHAGPALVASEPTNRRKASAADTDSYLNSKEFQDLTTPHDSRHHGSGFGQIGGAAGALAINGAMLGLDKAVNGD
jgi:hypothetical protein